jgi:hypothetical protein
MDAPAHAGKVLGKWYDFDIKMEEKRAPRYASPAKKVGQEKMTDRDAYLFYEAGQAVAAVHLKLTVRHISGNPARVASDILIPRNNPKARMVLWLTGMAAERKGVGKSSPLRRTRNRMRVRAQIESLMADLSGPHARRLAEARAMLNQAQDRANAICASLYDAIEEVVHRLRESETVGGEEIERIVRKFKSRGEPWEEAERKEA